jgi:hypothetical protein
MLSAMSFIIAGCYSKFHCAECCFTVTAFFAELQHPKTELHFLAAIGVLIIGSAIRNFDS